MKLKLFIYFILLCLFSCCPWSSMLAQTRNLQLQVRTYGLPQGLTTSGYKALLEDDTGLLWVLGANDVALSGDKKLRMQYYDGVTFRNTSPIEADGWNTDYEYQGYTLKGRKILFVSSSKKHVFLYHAQQNKLQEIFQKQSTYDSIGLTTGYEHRVFLVLYKNNTSVLCEWKEDGFEEFFTLEGNKNMIFLKADSSGVLVFFRENSMIKINFIGEVVYSKQVPVKTGSGLFISPTFRGIEVFYQNEKAFLVHPKDGSISQILEPSLFTNNQKILSTVKSDGFGNTLYFYVYPFRLQAVFLRTADGKIYNLSGLQKEITDVHNIVGYNFSKGFYCIGTTGLFKVEINDSAYTHYFFKEGIRKIKVLGGNLYVSTENGGIFISKHGIKNDFSLAYAFYFPRILERTADGSLLVNSDYDFFKIKNGNESVFSLKGAPFDGIQMSENTLLFATAQEVFLVDIPSWKSKPLQGIQYRETHKLHKINEHKLWVCHFNGLDELDIKSNVTKNIYHDHPILTICETGPLQWYMGSANGQLFSIQKKNNSYHINPLINLQTPIVTITKDGNERLWLGTYQGVYLFDPSSAQLTKIPDSFMPHVECNRHAAFYDSAFHRMYIGTVKGLSVFDIDNLDVTTPPLHLGFSFVRYYDDRRKKDTTMAFMGTAITNLHLDAYQRSFTAGIAPGFYFDKNIQYEYALLSPNGQRDTVWIRHGNNPELSFSNLQSGEYDLLIRARTESGSLPSKTIKMHMYVADFFYNTWWFYALILAIIFSVFLWWQRRLRAENVKLEGEVDKRTRELKKDKETIQQQAEKLEQLDKMKTQFYQNISHELKTPLSLISGPLASIKRSDEEQKEKTEQLWNLVDKNVMLLSKRVDELLELNRLQSQTAGLHASPVRLTNFINNHVDVFTEEARVKNIDLVLQNHCAEHAYMMDEEKVGKVVQNLIANALKYSPPGSTVYAVFSLQEDQFNIVVQDNGPGIPKEYQPYVYDKFYRIPGTGGSIQGSGIGLSIVKEYIDLLNGKIELTSALGKGTRFEISIPVKQGPKVEEEDNLPSLDTLLKNLPMHPETRILVVEDNEDLRTFLSLILSPLGTVILAENGKKAMDMLDSGILVDVIISDIMMPEVDGLGLLQFVKNDARWKKTPFIFLTARSQEGIKMSALRLGVDDYLTKPFSAQELVLRIQRLMHNYSIRKSTSNDNSGEEARPGDDKFEEMQHFVRNHLADPTFSVDALATYMGMSERSLRRHMQKEYGMGPKEFVMEMQMNILRELKLEKPWLTHGDLGGLVGFQDTRYMARLFFERFGYKLN